jgi:hypothetical protein
MSLNIDFQPIVAPRNYPPTRTFVTKWDVEIDNNRAKKIARRRDRDTKYFDDFDHHADSLPPIPILCEFEKSYENCDSDDDGEQTRQAWLRSIHIENDFYDRPPRKRVLFADEVSDFSDFKRVRA